MEIPVRNSEVGKLTVGKREVVWARVGGQIADGQPAWIPTQEQLKEVRESLERAFPGTHVIATHHLVDIKVIETMGVTNVKDRS